MDGDGRAVVLRDGVEADGRHQSMYVPLRWRVPKIRKKRITATNEISCMVTASAAVVGREAGGRIRLKTRSGAVSSPAGGRTASRGTR